MASALMESCPDVVHQHGLWIYPSLAGRQWKRKTGKVHIITPQGMLEPWVMKHHQWRKKVIWHIFEESNLQETDCINVNSDTELKHLRDLGLKTPVCIVPNGVDIPANRRSATPPPWADTWPVDVKVLLYLGRLHSKKGVKELVRAWEQARSESSGQQWRLAIIGWDQVGYGEELNQLISEKGLAEQVRWFGPAFGEIKEAALRSADAFVLPSFSEGLPMAVLEAWAYGLPVIMTRECNLEVGFTVGAAIEVRPEIESIAQGITRLWTLPESDLEFMGKCGFALVEERYTWPKVAADLMSVYKWFLGQGDRPDFLFE
jgi:poly(glycerol-phosphate) alpha-glucosyltransferase